MYASDNTLLVWLLANFLFKLAITAKTMGERVSHSSATIITVYCLAIFGKCLKI